MNIALPPEAAEVIRGLVATGEYRSLDEAITEGVFLLMNRQELRTDIQQGIEELDRGEGVPGEQVFAELRERAKKLTRQAE